MAPWQSFMQGGDIFLRLPKVDALTSTGDSAGANIRAPVGRTSAHPWGRKHASRLVRGLAGSRVKEPTAYQCSSLVTFDTTPKSPVGSDKPYSRVDVLSLQGQNGKKKCGQRAKAKTGETYPKNCAPAGPISTSLLANPSPSTMGGGLASLCLFTRRHVMRVGAVHFRGGMMIRIPWWRLPRMEPPLASTIKLTRNLCGGGKRSEGVTDRSKTLHRA